MSDEANEEAPSVPQFMFGAMDLLPLVELANEAYELGRSHPSMQVYMKPWMQKFADFMQQHQYSKLPEDAILPSSNAYLDMVAKGTAKNIINRMKENS